MKHLLWLLLALACGQPTAPPPSFFQSAGVTATITATCRGQICTFVGTILPAGTGVDHLNWFYGDSHVLLGTQKLTVKERYTTPGTYQAQLQVWFADGSAVGSNLLDVTVP